MPQITTILALLKLAACGAAPAGSGAHGRATIPRAAFGKDDPAPDPACRRDAYPDRYVVLLTARARGRMDARAAGAWIRGSFRQYTRTAHHQDGRRASMNGAASGPMSRSRAGTSRRRRACRWPAARRRPSLLIQPAPSCPGRRRVCRCRPTQRRLAAAASHGTHAVTQTARVEDHEETVDRGMRAPGLLVWRKIRVSASAAASRAPTLLSTRTWQLAA